MPNYSRTNADGSREAREELYDGTALVTVTSADGDVLAELVPSDEQAPPPEPPTIEEVFADVPVVSIEEANTTLLALKAALEARGII